MAREAADAVLGGLLERVAVLVELADLVLTLAADDILHLPAIGRAVGAMRCGAGVGAVRVGPGCVGDFAYEGTRLEEARAVATMAQSSKWR